MEYNYSNHPTTSFERKSGIWIMIIFGGLTIIGLFFFQRGVLKSDKQNFEAIKKSSLHGRIKTLEFIRHGFLARFTLNNDSVTYNTFFRPLSTERIRGFDRVAQIGDSISKEAYSDSIYLFNKGRCDIYFYSAR
jgi:hypothetical protein